MLIIIPLFIIIMSCILININVNYLISVILCALQNSSFPPHKASKGTETLPPGRATEGLGSRRISDGLQGSYLDGIYSDLNHQT